MGEFAAAKVNLCLHVMGRRPDGYHLLDGLAVFAEVGDWLTAEPATEITLRVEGVQGGQLEAGPENLVLRAARALAGVMGGTPGARLVLDKRLPVASGIGGGSADAAAALRLLARLWRAPDEVVALLPELALALGADVPVCLRGRAARMRGIGERLDDVAIPAFGLVLVNPGIGVSTAAVFRALGAARAGAAPPAPLPMPASFGSVDGLVAWLRSARNDLEAAALALCPPIAEVLAALARSQGCRLGRMSGSGATCFGIYDSAGAAARAAEGLNPGWWRWGGAVRG